MYCHPKEIFKNEELSLKFECPINKGILNDPFLDQCGHSFCNDCIKKWLESK